MLEIGDLAPEERGHIEARMKASGRRLEDVLTQATQMLSGLSNCAGLVVTAKRGFRPQACRIRRRGAGQGAGGDGVRGRPGREPADRNPAGPAGFGLCGKPPITWARGCAAGPWMMRVPKCWPNWDPNAPRWTRSPPRSWPTAWPPSPSPPSWNRGASTEQVLIVRGRSHLLDTVEARADIERVRHLFDDIERKNDLIRLLELVKDGAGVKIFIGSENRLFSCPVPRSSPPPTPMRPGILSG